MSSREKFTDLPALLIVIFITFVLRFSLLSLVEKSALLEVQMTAEKEGVAQLFFNSGAGYSEEDSTRATVSTSTAIQSVYLELPEGELISVRFDPINHPGNYTIHALRLVSQNHHTIRQVELDQLSAAANCELAVEDSALIVKATNDDPQLNLDVATLADRSFSNSIYLIDAVKAALFAGIIFMLLSLLSFYLLRKSLMSVLLKLPSYFLNNLYLINRPDRS